MAYFPPHYFDFNSPIRGREIPVQPSYWGYAKQAVQSIANPLINSSVGQFISAKIGQAASQISSKVSTIGTQILNNPTIRPCLQPILEKCSISLVRTDTKVLQYNRKILNEFGVLDDFEKAFAEFIKIFPSDGTAQKFLGMKKDVLIREMESPLGRELVQMMKTIAICGLANLATTVVSSKGSISRHSFENFLKDIVAHFAGRAECHNGSKTGGLSLSKQILNIKIDSIDIDQKIVQFAKALEPIVNEMLKAAFPKGLSSAGLGLIASFKGDRILIQLSTLIAVYCLKTEIDFKNEEFFNSHVGKETSKCAEKTAYSLVSSSPDFEKFGVFYYLIFSLGIVLYQKKKMKQISPASLLIS